MSDDMIKGILIERKRQEARRKAIKAKVGDILGGVFLFVGIYAMFLLGHAFGM